MIVSAMSLTLMWLFKSVRKLEREREREGETDRQTDTERVGQTLRGQ